MSKKNYVIIPESVVKYPNLSMADKYVFGVLKSYGTINVPYVLEVRDLAEVLGCTVQTAYHYVNKLHEHGLIIKSGHGANSKITVLY